MDLIPIISWSILLMVIGFIIYVLFKSYIYKSVRNINTNVRDIQIKQIKKSIKNMEITKQELFNDK